MNKKERAVQLMERIKQLENPPTDISQFFINDELAKINDQLNSNPTIRSLQKLNGDLQKLQTEVSKFKNFDPAPIQTQIKQVQTELKQGQVKLLAEFENRLRNLPKTDFTPQLEALRAEFDTRIQAIPKDDDSALEADLQNIKQQLQDMVLADETEDKQEKAEIDQRLLELKRELTNRINNLGGGSQPLQISVGNTPVNTQYADTNLIAGTNVTLTSANNSTTKKVDITVAATGGAVRSINSVSTTTNAGATAGTSYVYLGTGTFTITLPTAVGNTNLYTIKNVSTGIITVATTSAQTIDGGATAVIAARYNSIDLISDNANWNIV